MTDLCSIRIKACEVLLRSVSCVLTKKIFTAHSTVGEDPYCACRAIRKKFIGIFLIHNIQIIDHICNSKGSIVLHLNASINNVSTLHSINEVISKKTWVDLIPEICKIDQAIVIKNEITPDSRRRDPRMAR